MLAKVASYALSGLEGFDVAVEVDVNAGLPAYEVVGLADTAVKESRERVRAAIKNSLLDYPIKKITVNLAPADSKKEGSLYDLPIAVGILAATEQLPAHSHKPYVIVGELSLDGGIRHVKGLMPILLSAMQNGHTRFIVPEANAKEAAYVSGIQAYAFSSLKEVADFLSGEKEVYPVPARTFSAQQAENKYNVDFSEVKGQEFARRAMEIAVAGGHNILMIGPPGAGKTLMAKCVPTIMPDMIFDEAVEVTKIHSVAGILDAGKGIVTLESLRQPLEDGVVTVSRAKQSLDYPAKFMLVASMNPCPCGNFGSKTRQCRCTAAEIRRYVSRLSGPLLDRIDLQVEVDGISYEELRFSPPSEDSATIKARVEKARAVQRERYKGSGVHTNAQMTNAQMKIYCALSPECERILEAAFKKLNMTARASGRVLKVARTIADLEGSEDIKVSHITEAVQYRSLDRKYWE